MKAIKGILVLSLFLLLLPMTSNAVQMGGSIQGTSLNIAPALVSTFAGTAGMWGTADGTGTAARFKGPDGVTTDGTNLYVADFGNHTIRKVVISTGAVTTLAGTAGIPGFADGTGTAATFNGPSGITTDGTNLYVTDTVNHTIRKIVISTGVVTTIAGLAGNWGSVDGTGSAARFWGPKGITTDGTNLYIVDTSNYTIRKILISTGAVTTLAGTAGAIGSTDGTGTAARFNVPIGITTDGNNLYVTDRSNGTIRKIVIPTGAVTTLAGTAGVVGSADGTGNAASFWGPYGITTDGTNLYVNEDLNNTIRKIVISTGAVTTLAGTAGTVGSTDGTGTAARFNVPYGITTDGTNLYVVDNTNYTIRKIQQAATYTVTPSAGAGGTISPSTPQTINSGSTTTFTVTPNTGYTTASVSGTCGGTLVGTTYTTNTIIANCSVTASFAITAYTLTYTAGANGSITGTSPQTVSYGNNGSAVTAVPAANYHFVNWSDASIANPRTDTNVVANVTVTANFTINTYTVTTAATNGTITSTNNPTVNYNTTTTVTGSANNGYYFSGVSGCSGIAQNNTNQSITTFSYTTGAITVNCTMTATFAISTYAITYNGNGNTGGTAPTDGSSPYNYNSTVTVLGNTGSLVKTGYTFANWNTAANGTGTTYAPNATFTIAANTTLYAQWTANTFTVTATANGNGTGTVTSDVGGISYSYQTNNTGTTTAINNGSGVVVTATSGTGSTVSLAGVCTAAGGVEAGNGTTTATCTFSGLTANKTVAATFTLNTYTVTFNSNGGSAVTGQTINYNSTATSPTTPTKTGYTFVGWYSDSGLTTAFNFTTAITANTTLYAKWTINIYTVTPSAGSNGTISPSSSQTINSGSTTTFTVTPNSGYTATVSGTCGGTLSGNIYTTNAITVNCTVMATFTANNPTAINIGGSIQGAPLNILPTTVSVFGGSGVVGSADGTGSAASFNYPYNITTDGTNLYIADTNNNTIRKVVIATGAVTTIAGTAGLTGSVDGTGTAARFNLPAGITTDGTNLYIADTYNNTIRQVVIATGVVTTIAGTAGLTGSVDGTGTAARFNHPTGITTDGTNLYITDSLNHTIRKIVIATGAVTTIAGTAGVSGLTDGIGMGALFNTPNGITTDGTNLYITDTGNNKIRKIVISTGAVTTIAGLGVAGSTDGTGNAASFNLPRGITMDGTSLYVTDTGNNTIRKIVIATGAVTTIAGTAGVAGSVNGTLANFNHPTGITTDGTNLYIVDTNNQTIRQITINTYTVTPSAGTGGSITPSTPQTINSGSTTVFTVMPSAGYNISSVSGCGGTLSGNTYTTAIIAANCSVTTNFTAIVGGGGGGGGSSVCTYSLSPTKISVSGGGGASFNVNQDQTYCSNSGWTATSNNNWITITSGASGSGTTTLVSFSASNPTTSRTGTITITGQSNTATIAITQSAILTLSTYTLNYGTIKPLEAVTGSLTVTNTSGDSLTLSGAVITGADSTDFTLINNCNTLSNNGSCNLDIKFLPTTAGSKTATLTITANGISFTVALTGTANKNATPAIIVTPSEINSYLDTEFGYHDWITIGNNGTGTLSVSSIKFYGEDLYEYTVTGSGCSLILPQQSCSLQLSSRYTSNQAKTASLVIYSNASNAAKLEIPIQMSSKNCASNSINILPGSVTVSSLASTVTLTVTAPDNCWWTTSSKADWVNLTNGWTNGNGTVIYTISANTENSSRMGNVNIGGLPFTIIQYAASVSQNFDDISGYKFENNINALYSAGITISSPGFYPDNTATKGDIAAFIIRALYGENFAYTVTPYFSDVPANHPYFKYVQKLKDDNITWAEGAYGIDSGVRRSWAAAFIIRAIYGETFNYPSAPYFSDVPMNHVYFKYIQKMKERGFTHVSGEYSPDYLMPRDALAAFISDAFLGMEHY